MEGQIYDYVILISYYLSSGFFLHVLKEMRAKSWEREDDFFFIASDIFFLPILIPLATLITVICTPKFVADLLINFNDKLKEGKNDN